MGEEKEGERGRAFGRVVDRLVELSAKDERLESLLLANDRLEALAERERQRGDRLQRQLLELDATGREEQERCRREVLEYRSLYRVASDERDREQECNKRLQLQLERAKDALLKERQTAAGAGGAGTGAGEESRLFDRLLKIYIDDNPEEKTKWKRYVLAEGRCNLQWQELCEKLATAVANTACLWRKRKRTRTTSTTVLSADEIAFKAPTVLFFLTEHRRLHPSFVECVNKMIYYDGNKGKRNTTIAKLERFEQETITAIQNLTSKVVATAKEEPLSSSSSSSSSP